jgi:DNA invertase Pin-like site-specific DNA recombinase
MVERAVGYVRASSNDQSSLEAQRAALKAYEAKGELVLDFNLTETGRTSDRPRTGESPAT